MRINVTVIRRETERALQLVVFDDLPCPVAKQGRHRVLWLPKSMIAGRKPEAGERDVEIEVQNRIVQLEGWEWLVEWERRAFLEEYG